MANLHVERFSLSGFPHVRGLAERLSVLKAQVSTRGVAISVCDLYAIGHDRRTQYLFLQIAGPTTDLSKVVGMLSVVVTPMSGGALLGPIVVDRQGPIRGSGTELMRHALLHLWEDNPQLERIDLTSQPARGLLPWYQRFGFTERETAAMRLVRQPIPARP